MICGLTGRIAAVGDDAAIIENGALAYQVLVPRASLAELQKRVGDEITLFTQQYIEGNPNTGNLIPRIVGFLTESERDFFHRQKDFMGIYDVWRKGLDLLIYTPTELADMLARENPFIERALTEGVVIYEE